MLLKGYQQPVQLTLAVCQLEGASLQRRRVQGWPQEMPVGVVAVPWDTTLDMYIPVLCLGFPTHCAVTVALPVLQALLAASESCCGALGKAERYCYNYCLQSSARSLLFVFSFIFGWCIQTLDFNVILSVLSEPAPPAAVVCYEIVTFVLTKKMHANALTDGIQSIKGGKPPRHFVKLF